jgi:FlaA1/EpsC-like NDP-sugar epimerase
MSRPLISLNPRSFAAFVHDVAASAVAWCAAYWLRFNLEVPPAPFLDSMFAALAWVVPGQSVLFLAFGLYRGIWRYASVPDLRRIFIVAVLSTMAISMMVVVARVPGIPRSVLLLDPLLLVILMGGSRLAYRAWKDRSLALFSTPSAKPVLVLGAGDAAADLIKNIGRSSQWRIVGLLDDNEAKHHRQIQGLTVLGPLASLEHHAARLEVRHAVIAMPAASHSARRHALDICARAGLSAMTVPSYDDIVSGKVTMSQLRNIELDDLLGRDPVELDNAGLRSWLSGRTVMVTGAGGSIGSELCRQLARYEPGLLVLLEQNEYALYRVAEEFAEFHPSLRTAAVIADVKNEARLAQVIGEWRPSALFHAAAYKHVPLMEDLNAWEAVQNNVAGTLAAARAAEAAGVEKFVMVSTDKAVNPVSVMGATKRLAELVCARFQGDTARFVTVRFGNVIGSTGSVVPKFREQIARGGPITVTHPQIQRYFMSIPEAAQLVLQAGLMGKGGEIFVLDMGEPVMIVDLARDLIRLSGLSEQDIPLRFTGLRPGEKLFEEPLADNEHTLPTPHAKLRVARAVSGLSAASFSELEAWLAGTAPLADDVVRTALVRFVPEYVPGPTRPEEPARYTA